MCQLTAVQLDEPSHFRLSKGPPHTSRGPISLPPVTPSYETDAYGERDDGSYRERCGVLQSGDNDGGYAQQSIDHSTREAGPSTSLATAKPKIRENGIRSEVRVLFYTAVGYSLY